MSAKPVIGITAFEMQQPDPPQSALYALGRRYVRAIEETGGAPVVAPPGLSEDSLRRIFDRFDGWLLSGGGDIDPALYGEPPQAPLFGVSVDRDRAELALARWAIEGNKPLLCICRGLQVLNVALGGTLIQDIPTQRPGALEHSFDSRVIPRDHLAHSITVEPGSRLASALGAQAIQVNSWHHQAVNGLGQGLQAVAWSPDGIIEAVETAAGAARSFAIGVQWHPEWLYDKQAEAKRLFAALIQAASGE